MSGFLDTYGAAGAADDRRRRLVKRTVLWGLLVAILSTVGYYTLRTWPQERKVKQFLALIEQKDYRGAYNLWGCTPETPCKYYPPEKFAEDWGPESAYVKASGSAKVDDVDYCGAGVVFRISYAPAESVSLWVDRENNAFSFSPWARCPGPHLQLGRFFR